MFALQFTEYGGPEVISLGEAPSRMPGRDRSASRFAPRASIPWTGRSGQGCWRTASP